MEFDFAFYHEPLLKSEHALKLGQIHCALLVADNAYEKQAKVQKTEKDGAFDYSPIELTPFGEETLGHFVKWWVRKKVHLLDQITKKIQEVLPCLDNLKRVSLKLNQISNVSKYEDLIDELKRFGEENSKDIEALYSFVFWLHNLDEISPCILFTHPPWSTTQLSDRYLKIEKCNEAQIRVCTEIVSGLRWHGMPTLAYVRNDIESDWAENVDPEYSRPSPITYESAFSQASKKILYEFALYFQKIRDSVELVQSEMISFSKEEILKNEEFLNLFISKALPEHRVECDLWDFKETIPAWHNTRNEKLKSDFACNVASFANSNGGLLLIGINDLRKIVGIEKVETKIQQSRSLLEAFLDNFPSSLEIFSLPLKNESGKIVNCLVIRIPQTKEVVGVRDTSGGASYKYPVRTHDGIKYKNHQEIAKLKKEITKDNFLFSKSVSDFVYFNEK
jgi:uncharacterized protein YqgQ